MFRNVPQCSMFLVLSTAIFERRNCIFGPMNKYALLTKREVKMAGYWTSSFFVEVHKNAKKERGQYPAILTEEV